MTFTEFSQPDAIVVMSWPERSSIGEDTKVVFGVVILKVPSANTVEAISVFSQQYLTSPILVNGKRDTIKFLLECTVHSPEELECIIAHMEGFIRFTLKISNVEMCVLQEFETLRRMFK